MCITGNKKPKNIGREIIKYIMKLLFVWENKCELLIFDLMWYLIFSSLLERKEEKYSKSKTRINKVADKKIATDLLSKENQYLKIPTEKVSIPKYFTAPYSFRISMTTRIRPENIPENERGIMILCMILNLERLKFCDKFK